LPSCGCTVMPIVKEELLPSESRPEMTRVNPQTLRYSFRNNLKKAMISLIVFAVLAWLAVFFGRSFYDGLLGRFESNRSVHEDNTKITTGIISQTEQAVNFTYRNKEGKLIRVLANREKFSAFAKENIPLLEQNRVDLRDSVETTVPSNNKEIFHEMHGRVKDYADWYFAYTTTYKILWEALFSFKQHTLETSPISTKKAVTLDVERYIKKHFEKIILKPELSDTKINSSFQYSLQIAHEQYLRYISNFDEKFQLFLSSETTHMQRIDNQKVKVDIDWKRQFNKVSLKGYEKGSEGALVGAGLTVGGMLAGKAIASGAAKVFLAKLSIPFATKAVAVAGSAAVGAAAGAVAGPAGVVAGAGLGILVDVAINEGVDLANRDKFEKDTHEVLDSLSQESNSKQVESIQKAVDVWFNDTINILAKYSSD